jgi:hypothetical protein
MKKYIINRLNLLMIINIKNIFNNNYSFLLKYIYLLLDNNEYILCIF